jgi:3-methyladenine DNA glycosylase AlkD
VATTAALNQKGRAHVAETLKVVENVMNDKEPMVQKAVAWTLKEASQKDERQVFEYLKRWQGRAQPRIIREGSEKLPPELRKELLA